jgi:hypothetical protein
MKTIAIILIFLSCTGVQVLAQPKPPLKSLNVGNFWVYKYSTSRTPRADITGDAYERVTSKQMINGKEYATVYNSYFKTFFLERSDSNNVYRWDGTKEVTTYSLLWEVGDTVNLQFLWHGCSQCKYIIDYTTTSYAPNLLKDTIYSFSLRDVIPRLPMPVAPYRIAYVRKYFINQLDTSGLARDFRGEYAAVLGATLLKGALVDGVAIRDTNIITSVEEIPTLASTQQKQGNASTQASQPRIAIAVSAENPFTTRTQVRYRLEQGGSVELAAYNAQGIRLTTFARSTQAIGEHTATWNGTNAEGQDVPSGTYFLVVFVNDRQVGEVKVVKLR